MAEKLLSVAFDAIESIFGFLQFLKVIQSEKKSAMIKPNKNTEFLASSSWKEFCKNLIRDVEENQFLPLFYA